MKDGLETKSEEGLTRVYRFRIYPTAKQTALLNTMLADHCLMYNAALEETKLAWKHPSKTSINYYAQCKQLKEIRKVDPFGLGRWSFSSEQQTLRRLHIARAAFFRRVRAGQTPGFPRYKSIRTFNTVSFINGDGGKWNEAENKVYVLGIGHIKVKLHRPTKGIAKQFSITREGKHWFVNVVCVKIPKELQAPTGSIIGVDVGVTNLLADSNGNLYPNPRPARTHEERLASAQRALSRRKKGSYRWVKNREHIATIHRSTRKQRLDNSHKISHKLVSENDIVVLEALKIANMVKRAKPRKNPDGTYAPNGATAKSRLSNAVHDAGWAMIRRMTLYKAENAGIEVILVPPAYTSQMCYECKFVDAGNRNGEAFKCLACGHRDHADINAAKNILRLGLSLRENCLQAA